MENKNEILERLIREGHLKLEEALVLLEKESIPQLTHPSLSPPYPHYAPWPREPIYGDGFKITCNETTVLPRMQQISFSSTNLKN